MTGRMLVEPRGVLVIEDNPVDSGVAWTLVEDALPGARVATAGSLAAAEGHLRRHACDVIITDLGLPDSDSTTTVGRLAHLCPAALIVVLSAHDDAEPAVTALQAGAHEYLVKGRVDAAGLKHAVLDGLARKQADIRCSRARRVVDTALDGFLAHDLGGYLFDVNTAYCTLSGYDRDALIGSHIGALKADGSAREAISHIVARGHATYESRHHRRDGGLMTLAVSATYHPEEGGQITAFVRDVTEQKRMEAELRRLATTDSLTGVLNRRSFLDTLEAEVARSRRHGHALVVAMLDLDHFKHLNDTCGHAGGDAALQRFVEGVRPRLRAGDSLGRLGGEEFALILPETDAAGGHRLLERLVAERAADSLDFRGHAMRFTVSAGHAALAEQPEASGESLLGLADARVYEAKRRGRNRLVGGSSDRGPVGEGANI